MLKTPHTKEKLEWGKKFKENVIRPTNCYSTCAEVHCTSGLSVSAIKPCAGSLSVNTCICIVATIGLAGLLVSLPFVAQQFVCKGVLVVSVSFSLRRFKKKFSLSLSLSLSPRLSFFLSLSLSLSVTVIKIQTIKFFETYRLSSLTSLLTSLTSL